MRASDVPDLQGEQVSLRPVAKWDIEPFFRWYDDPDVRRWLHHSDRPDATLGDIWDRYGPESDRPEARWTIVNERRPVGLCRLEGIDTDNGRAELAVLIGEKEAWSRGYGADAIRCVLRYAFGDLGLRRVWLITDADNRRGQRCFEKCGFVREALLRKHRLRHGRPLDMIAMGILREEFPPDGNGR